MKEMGVIANVQPQFVHTDSLWAEKRLPSELLKYAYSWKTLMNNEIIVTGGSDAPIEVPNPLYGLYYAITRKGADGKVFKPEECLTFREAVKLYTGKNTLK